MGGGAVPRRLTFTRSHSGPGPYTDAIVPNGAPAQASCTPSSAQAAYDFRNHAPASLVPCPPRLLPPRRRRPYAARPSPPSSLLRSHTFIRRARPRARARSIRSLTKAALPAPMHLRSVPAKEEGDVPFLGAPVAAGSELLKLRSLHLFGVPCGLRPKDRLHARTCGDELHGIAPNKGHEHVPTIRLARSGCAKTRLRKPVTVACWAVPSANDSLLQS